MFRSLRVTGAVVGYLAILVAADLAGTALHHHSASAAVSIPTGDCPLQTTTARDGRAVVTYADDTGDARMAAAIRSAVADWNHAPVNVQLVPDANFAALTFRAGTHSSAIPTCSATTARTVSITLSAPLWAATTGPKTVVDPVGSVAKDIGRALGLPGGGTCPDLMAPSACSSRNTAPNAHESAVIDALYAARAGAGTTP